jgi:hypothetical protein
MPQLSGSFIISGSITISGSNGNVIFGGNNNTFYTGVTISGSLAQGQNTLASGNFSHAEGTITTASNNAHAEGFATQALGAGSHAEGTLTITNGQMSHAEGNQTQASGYASHTEGFGTSTTVGAHHSHAEGLNTTAGAPYSHAEGLFTSANGTGSHAGGYLTAASRDYQTVFGEYNNNTNTSSLFAIGTGDASHYVDGFSVDRISGSAYISTILLPLVSSSLNYANDSAAATGGVPLGGLYHTGGTIKIRLI